MQHIGNISPSKCWTMLKNQDAVLIDVRTKEEWAYVGVPVVADDMNQPIFQQWQIYPQMVIDENYCQNLTKKLTEIGKDKKSNLCFLCRSGVRSQSAADTMKEAGYEKCFNVTDGFEGQVDKNNQRGKISGWKFENLPWRQL